MPQYPANLSSVNSALNLALAIGGLLLDATEIPDRSQYPTYVEIEATMFGRKLLQGCISVWSTWLGQLLKWRA